MVLVTGADVSRSLGVPAKPAWEPSAGEFVAWYNGHPDSATVISISTARLLTVIGHGNVALDVARILAKTADQCVGRILPGMRSRSGGKPYSRNSRGWTWKPSRAKFTAKELRDSLDLGACETTVDLRDVAPDDFTPENPRDPELVEKLSLFARFRSKFRQSAVDASSGLAFRRWRSGGRAGCKRSPSRNSFTGYWGTLTAVWCFAASAVAPPLWRCSLQRTSGVHANIEGRVVDGRPSSPAFTSAVGASAARAARSHQPRLWHDDSRGRSRGSARARGAAFRRSRCAAGAAALTLARMVS